MNNKSGNSREPFPNSENDHHMAGENTFSAVPLLSLKPGERAVLDNMRFVPPRIRQRLLELGLLGNTLVELVRFAPLGDPVQLKVDGANISLRRGDASSITVRKVA